jgi:hypothetical protein
MENTHMNWNARAKFCGSALLMGSALVLSLTAAAMAQARRGAAGAEAPDANGLYNAALLDLGATAKGSGSPFNKDWPPNNVLESGSNAGSGTMFGGPLKGGRVDIRLVIPVEIQAVEVLALDYNGTVQPNGVDVFVEGKQVKHADLPETPGKPFRIELDAPVKGQMVGFLVTGDYPIRTLANGTKGPNWGGWSRLRVLTSTNVAEMMKDVPQYQVPASPANIAPTAGAMAGGKVEVVGEPRTTKGHPCTLWDAEDIAHFKDMLKTSKELQAQYAGLTKAMDVRITQPLGIPEPKKGPDGKWMHIIDTDKLGESTVGAVHNQLGLDIANLGELYALSGEAKYAEFAKKLLLAYADVHGNYGIGARQGFNHDPSRVFDQRLGDATWGIQVARGYDLIHDLPSITAEERKHIDDDLIKAVGWDIVGNHAMLEAETNWSAIATCAVLMCGCASDDQKLIDTALWGINGTKDKPTGGLFQCHFGPGAIDQDGMWAEGAMGYQFMALEALIMDAEVLWHHGLDMYRYRDCALKRLFDTPITSSYPDLTTAAIHDSGHGSIIGSDSFLYEYAYRRYRDPAYLLILNQSGTHLDAQFQKFPVSVLYDRDPKEKTAPVEWKSVNFFGVGYGILRQTTPAGTTSLLLEYGPNRSHGHPDKLTVDYYAFNDQLIIDPGSIWYEQPLYQQWYHPTLSHSTLVVDELSQKMCGAQQLTYGPADTIAIQRARTNEAYAGVMMDRSLFLTPNYLADVFGAFAALPRKMDLVWHIRGDFASDLKMEPTAFPKPAENGYVALTNVRHAETDKPWSATISRKGNVARFLAAGGAPTDVIVADGLYGIEKPPTIIERRTVASTVYGNVVDVSGAKDGYVKGVTIEGDLERGYGLLTVKTPIGEDLCFASYRPGTYKVGGIETDAQQAMVVKTGDQVTAMYLGGGNSVKVWATELCLLYRTNPGLAFIEKAETGAYILSNPSPAEGRVGLVFKPIVGMDAYELDADGKRAGKARIEQDKEGIIEIAMKAGAKVEFAPKGAQSVYDYRRGMLAKRQQEQEAALAKAKDECVARDKVRQAEAKAKPAPAGTILAVRAADFTTEGDGNVGIVSGKRASVGKSINQWDAAGQWVEWTFDAPAEGYYHLTICYCSELDKMEREIKVNGEVQEPFAPMVLPSTGGWANGSDDWRLYTATNPVTEQPLLIKLKAGKNVLHLTNTNGRGANVDWLAMTSPDVKIERQALAAKLK